MIQLKPCNLLLALAILLPDTLSLGKDNKTITSKGTIKVITGEVAPFSYTINKEKTGIVYEVAKRIFHENGKTFSPAFYPWQRALRLSQKNQTISFPLTRHPYREKNYSWVGPIYEDKHMFIALKKSYLEGTGEEDLKNYPVGVVRYAPPEVMLKQRQYPSLVKATTHAQLLKMLVGGKIKLWYDSEAIIAHTIEMSGLDPAMFNIVREDVNVTQYIVLSKDLESRTAELNKKITSMTKSGELQKIINEHLSPIKLKKFSASEIPL